jgi:drug/metabolite transporter (DMT)-like permease
LLAITIGFQREKAGIASVMRYFDVVFVILWDATVLGEQPHALTLVGGAIILSGASVIAFRKG